VNLVFRDYGNGLVECGYSNREPSRCSPLVSSPCQPSGVDENARRNAARARTAIRRRIMSLGLDHMLTLTYRVNLVDFDQAVRDLRAFMKIVRREIPGYRWVAVPERQERGAWHWHIAVKGFQNVRFLREAWKRVVGDGNIDVKGPGRKVRVGKLKLAYYLVKYISKKSDDVKMGLHRYFGTRERGDVDILKIGVDRVSNSMIWIREILENEGLRLRQIYETAFGGWGATWESAKLEKRMMNLSCTG